MATQTHIADEVRDLFERKGNSQYGGETVTQQEHALQAAWLAEQEKADASTIAAALLHDVGHMLHELDDDAPDRGIDDRHEKLGNDWLVDRFPATVCEPVRLHVQAKRYLCTVDPQYRATLSQPSITSLALQGGDMSEAELDSLRQHPLFEQIIQVRRYDDLAKEANLKTPNVEHFLQYVERCAGSHLQIDAS